MKIACTKCGANVTFAPKDGKCYCEHCDSRIEVNDFNIENIEYEHLNCSSCGAQLIVGENDVVTMCTYCGSNQILVQKLENNKINFNPDIILPFKVDKTDVVPLVNEFIKNHKEHFKFLDRKIDYNKDVKGIYVPYAVYTWQLNLYLMGKKQEYEYQDIEILEKDLGKKFDENIMDALQTFDIENAVQFNPAFLAGFYAELQDELPKKIDKGILQRFYYKSSYQEAIHKINRMVEKSKKYTLNDIELKIALKEKKLALLPVWFIKAGSRYDIAINGRTGVMATILKYGYSKEMLIFNNSEQKYIRKEDIKHKETKLERILTNLLLFSFAIFFIIIAIIFTT